ncbi:hypothetical protein K227x_36350 [Rubripirellula lacrimiformis]|uniref:Uncharacterized protein n=1 Tax=Rubripirellula lacrimiformis TaxID=1930273 RepID=A0A517NDN8_9BACT|nr:hypothetical protein K227x_36350 [Rubripirellula lacrimiformis]
MNRSASLTDEIPSPKFAKPRMMLIDIDERTDQCLRAEGFNVTTATLGAPRRVERSDNLYPVDHSWADLSGHEEQEILMINTALPDSIESGFIKVADGVEMLWQTAEQGEIDARPLVSYGISETFDTIMEHGGLAVVFLGSRYERTYLQGSMFSNINFRDTNKFEFSSWSFSSHLERFGNQRANGSEIHFLNEGNALSRLLRKGAEGSRYQTRISPNYDQRDHFLPLAKDKYDNTVAGLLIRNDPMVAMLLLPQMPDFHVIAADFIRDWCAQWRPHLFPFHDKQAWLHSDRYELASINQKKARIAIVRKEADAEIEKLHSEIEADRKANADWYVLLNGTGDELVEAVMNTLRQLGFQDVVDMDEQARQDGTEKNLREDVQVRDRDPILVVDIKGIVGTPADDESTQAQKHATMRTRELNQFVKPLTIINHQRNLPPHERSPEPYRPEIVQNADDIGLGLMTTWDLFLLRRNQERLGWTSEHVLPIFYRDGRINPIPEHYEEIGVLAHVWKKAFGIVPSRAFPKGSRLAVLVGDLFHELPVSEIKCDGVSLEIAPQGGNCGIACNDTSQFREKMRVFVVS